MTPTCPAPTVQPVDAVPTGQTLSATWPGPSGLHVGLDMDGDGTPDTISTDAEAGVVTITTGEGAIRVERPAAIGFFGPAADDLDGDGRDEAIFTVAMRSLFGPQDLMMIVAGTTAPGPGLVKFAPNNAGPGHVIGDVTGDGLDDLLSRTIIYPELAISAADAIDARSAPDPGAARAAMDRIGTRSDLDFDGAADIVRIGSVDGTHPPRLVLSSGPELQLAPTWPGNGAHLVEEGSRRWVVLDDYPEGSVSPADHEAFRVRVRCVGTWLLAVAPVLAGRAPIPSDALESGAETDPSQTTREATALRLIRSADGRGKLVDDRFTFLVGRAPDPGGRSFWVGALRTGRRTPTQMFAELLASDEVYRKSGSSVGGWVDVAFERALGRPADPGGKAYWSRQAVSLGRRRAAARLLASDEARRVLVRTYLTNPELLGEAMTQADVTHGVNVRSEHGFDVMLADLASGDTVYARAYAAHGP